MRTLLSMKPLKTLLLELMVLQTLLLMRRLKSPISHHERAACNFRGRPRSWGCWARTLWTTRPRTSRWRCTVHLSEAGVRLLWEAGSRRGIGRPDEYLQFASFFRLRQSSFVKQLLPKLVQIFFFPFRVKMPNGILNTYLIYFYKFFLLFLSFSYFCTL